MSESKREVFEQEKKKKKRNREEEEIIRPNVWVK